MPEASRFGHRPAGYLAQVWRCTRGERDGDRRHDPPPGAHEILRVTHGARARRARHRRRHRAGETVALLGPNGAGKSTTIDMLLGLPPPDAGRSRVFGQSPAEAIAAGAIGAMLQTGALIRDLSVRELLDDDGVAVPDARSASTRCSSSPAIARHRRPAHPEALRRPDPAGPVRGRARLRPRPARPRRAHGRHGRRGPARVLGRRCAASPPRGKTIVFATHYLEEADAYADRAVLMARGRIVADGPTTEIKAMVGPAHDPRDAPRRRPRRARALPGVDARRAPRRGGRPHCSDSDAAIRALLARLPRRRATSRSPAPGSSRRSSSSPAATRTTA